MSGVSWRETRGKGKDWGPSRTDIVGQNGNDGEHYDTIDNVLSERGKNYGEFDGHAEITQDIKRAMKAGKKWDLMSDSKQEALEMIAHKIGRIINGDPNYKDSWTDIIGYATLIEKGLK